MKDIYLEALDSVDSAQFTVGLLDRSKISCISKGVQAMRGLILRRAEVNPLPIDHFMALASAATATYEIES